LWAITWEQRLRLGKNDFATIDVPVPSDPQVRQGDGDFRPLV
jgi:hypothetical protein